MPFKRVHTGAGYCYVPGAIRNVDDIPRVSEKIVILSLTEAVDDCAYEIIERDVRKADKQYLLVNALAYTPGRAAHVDSIDGTILFSYQTLGITPIVFSIRSPFYATLPLQTYQALCKSKTHKPKGKGGEDALQLLP